MMIDAEKCSSINIIFHFMFYMNSEVSPLNDLHLTPAKYTYAYHMQQETSGDAVCRALACGTMCRSGYSQCEALDSCHPPGTLIHSNFE
eukprot:168294-Pleurochrysis_carterae.AAC.1